MSMHQGADLAWCKRSSHIFESQSIMVTRKSSAQKKKRPPPRRAPPPVQQPNRNRKAPRLPPRR
jgi:hypothetical protein